MTREQAVGLAGDDAELLFLDGFDDALIGVASICHTTVALYDRRAIIEILVKEGCSEEAAEEHFDYNIAGSYVGERTPAIATLAHAAGPR